MVPGEGWAGLASSQAKTIDDRWLCSSQTLWSLSPQDPGPPCSLLQIEGLWLAASDSVGLVGPP